MIIDWSEAQCDLNNLFRIGVTKEVVMLCWKTFSVDKKNLLFQSVNVD